MRTFIAVDVPNKIKREIAKIQNDLKKAGIGAKWIKPENIHLTVAFLGSIDNKKTKQIRDILSSINRLIKKQIKLRLRNLSAFPDLNQARVIFIDVLGQTENLNNLAMNVRSGLKNKKIWFDEKPFIAHLTLGRFKKLQGISQLAEKIVIKKISFAVKEVSLYQSQFSPAGSIYTKL